MKILSGHWYGWQTIPETLGAPYFAPIRICSAILEAHQNTIIALTFLRPTYPQGVKQSHARLRILYPTHEHLFATLEGSAAGGTIAIVSELTHAWLNRCCPAVAAELGSSVQQIGVQRALDAILTLH